MKLCSKCKLNFPKSEFSPLQTAKDGLHNWCRPCKAAGQRDYYQRNREKCNSKSKQSTKQRREKNRYKIWDYLSNHPCVSCGESNLLVLDFDHLDPSKKIATISFLMSKGTVWSKIEKEIEKCQVLCANCHRRKNRIQLGWYDGIEVS